MKKSILFLFLMLSGGWLFANHWIPEDSQFEDNMTLTGVIQLDGVEQQSTMLEVGVFCGDQCRGSGMPTFFAPTQRYIIQLTIFGEIGDQLTFKLYDQDNDTELDVESPEAVTFTANGYGNLSEPYVLNFTGSTPGPGPEPDEVVVTLNPGWNWISYLMKTATPMDDALINLTPSEGDLIKGMFGSSIFQNGSWQGSLEEMTPGVGYMYYNNSNEVKTFTYPNNTTNQP